jgi:hypothetical protein
MCGNAQPHRMGREEKSNPRAFQLTSYFCLSRRRDRSTIQVPGINGKSSRHFAGGRRVGGSAAVETFPRSTVNHRRIGFDMRFFPCRGCSYLGGRRPRTRSAARSVVGQVVGSRLVRQAALDENRMQLRRWKWLVVAKEHPSKSQRFDVPKGRKHGEIPASRLRNVRTA